jgi:hypothetical protein
LCKDQLDEEMRDSFEMAEIPAHQDESVVDGRCGNPEVGISQAFCGVRQVIEADGRPRYSRFEHGACHS